MLTLTLLNWKVAHRGNHYDAFTEIDFFRYDDREGMTLVRPVWQTSDAISNGYKGQRLACV